MTSEQDDSHAIWQGPNHSGQPDDLTSTPGAPGQQQLVASPQAPPPQGEKPSFFSRERLGRFARQFSPVLVPLPFAALIFLFTLPVALRGQSNLPLLPMGVLLVALCDHRLCTLPAGRHAGYLRLYCQFRLADHTADNR